MPKFAANLHYLFSEVPFLDRFEAAASAGFKAVEFQIPYDYPPEDLASRLRETGLQMVLLDTPPGDWDRGERGLAALPGRETEYRDGVAAAIDYARALDCELVHVVAGCVPDGVSRGEAEAVYKSNLTHAAEACRTANVTVVIEPINGALGMVDGRPTYTTEGMPGYFLNFSDQARRIIDELDNDNIALHLDCYHMQLLEGHLAATLDANMDILRHVQVSGVPGRHEPDIGEIHYPFIFDFLDERGYQGWVGCEYRPKGDTLAGLGWAKRYGIAAQAA